MRSGYDFDGGVGGFLRRDPCDPCARDGRRSGRNNACPAGDRLAIARQTYDMTTRYDGVKYENENTKYENAKNISRENYYWKYCCIRD